MHCKRVLLVDSDAVAVNLALRALRGAGYDVIQAGSCAAARSLDTRFETGVFELEVGDGNGIELAGELLARGIVERVVFFTFERSAAVLHDALHLGFVIHKGASAEDLLDAVRGAARPASHVPPGLVSARRGGSRAS